MSVCRMDEWSIRRMVTSYSYFGLLGATHAVFRALFFLSFFHLLYLVVCFFTSPALRVRRNGKDGYGDLLGMMGVPEGGGAGRGRRG